MASVLSDYAGNLALSTLLRAKGQRYWLALHTAPLSAAGTGDEVGGGGYERQPITFSQPASRTCASTNAQDFTGMPACTVTYLAVWTAISDGDMVFSILLNTPVVVGVSAQFVCATGDVALTI